MKKLLIMLLAVMFISAAGCSAPVVQTVVLDEETAAAGTGITVSEACNVPNDSGLKHAEYVGFDRNARLVGVSHAGILFYWDADLKTRTKVDVPGVLTSADVVNTGEYIIAETLLGEKYAVLLYPVNDLSNPTEIGRYAASSRTMAPQWKGGAAYACFVTNEPWGYVLNTYNGEDLTSMRVNSNMLSGYRAANMIQGYTLEDAFYIGSDWVVIKASFNLRTYYAVAELVDGDITDVIILESAGEEAVPTYSGMYYIDKQNTLMFYDAVNKVNEERAHNVKCFDVAVKAGLAAYVKREGSAEKLYVMHADGTGKTLVDVNSGIAALDISDDGSRLLVSYGDADIPAAVYMLEY